MGEEGAARARGREGYGTDVVMGSPAGRRLARGAPRSPLLGGEQVPRRGGGSVARKRPRGPSGGGLRGVFDGNHGARTPIVPCSPPGREAPRVPRGPAPPSFPPDEAMIARSQALLRLAPLGLVLALSACSGGGGGDAGGALFIESCSLGCGSGAGGNQVSCAIVNVGRNVEISVLFSEPLDPGSIDNSTFRVINTTTGQVPPMSFSVDPLDPRRLIARPTLTFDTLGNPVFALDENETYEVRIPGEAQDPVGPFIRSRGGRRNQSRLQCTIRTTEGVIDPVPGAPNVTVTVDTLSATGVPAQGAFDVRLDSSVLMVFDDIMNPATLADPLTQEPAFVRAYVDPDGNVADPSDQVELTGSYVWDVDFDLLRTTMVFTPNGGFPSRGSDPVNPRKIVIDIPNSVRDLVGNQLENAGKVVFTTEFVPFGSVCLPDDDGENFLNDNNHDVARSGADWGESLPGALTFGVAGGSGRLGTLVVKTGQTIVLNTDSQTFPLPEQAYELITNEQPTGNQAGDPGDYDPSDPGSWPTITVTDGVFEFSKLIIENNATLVLEGSNPGRVFSCGDLVVNGILDCSGETPAAHPSNSYNVFQDPEAHGGPGGAGGPNGGDGGAGGDRYDHSDTFNALNSIGAVDFPGNPATNPGADNDGREGEGVGNDEVTFIAAGQGGEHYPPNMIEHNNTSNAAFGDAAFSYVDIDGTDECRVAMVAAPGSGGAYALDGGPGVPVSPFTAVEAQSGTPLPNTPAQTPGGDSAALNLPPPGGGGARELDPLLGHLRGGAGGGGGGLHTWGTRSNGTPGQCFGSFTTIFPYWDHSGAGGGGGGGAVQATSGRTLFINGVVDASGGDGGSATIPGQPMSACTSASPSSPENVAACAAFASPGGGGSGGAIRLQARSLSILDLPGRVDVSGGAGGVGVGGSVGGDGGPGLVRLEFVGAGSPETEADNFAGAIVPFLPTDPTFNDPYTSAAILSIGELPRQILRPDSFTASMSCWMKPEGNFFSLLFDADVAGSDDPADKGWNMDILYDTSVPRDGIADAVFPYRGIPTGEPDYPLSGQDFETFFGNGLNHGLPTFQGSIIAVRFQGARLEGDLVDPCNVELSGVDADIAPGSLTPWVRHPADLNLFSPEPNMIRFCVVLEKSMQNPFVNPIESRVVGVSNLRICTSPD